MISKYLIRHSKHTRLNVNDTICKSYEQSKKKTPAIVIIYCLCYCTVEAIEQNKQSDEKKTTLNGIKTSGKDDMENGG